MDIERISPDSVQGFRLFNSILSTKNVRVGLALSSSQSSSIGIWLVDLLQLYLWLPGSAVLRELLSCVHPHKVLNIS